MKFVWIPAGCFKMGCVSGNQCVDDEKPVHKVCLDGFWMGKYEVTQAQWKTIKRQNSSTFKGDNNPVENVSWYDTQDFILKLNHRAGKDLFRLPTEAEWEYAARAGTQSVYSFGNNVSRLGIYAWYSGNSLKKTHTVGSLKPNAWGLYDMLGNVGEWCQDVYNVGAYRTHSHKNPLYKGSGVAQVKRGGNWYGSKTTLRVAYRGLENPESRSVYLGFRLVRYAE